MTNPMRRDRGWTRRPKIALLLQRGVARFAALNPWAKPTSSFDSEHDLGFLMLTGEEVLALHPLIPASMEPQYGHNDGPSWNECARLAADYPELLFAGFLKPPARSDEGIDLDAVYIPHPDSDVELYSRIVTRADGTLHGPDEDGMDSIAGRPYRRLWWD